MNEFYKGARVKADNLIRYTGLDVPKGRKATVVEVVAFMHNGPKKVLKVHWDNFPYGDEDRPNAHIVGTLMVSMVTDEQHLDEELFEI